MHLQQIPKEPLPNARPFARRVPRPELSTYPADLSKTQDAAKGETQATLHLFICPTTSVPLPLLLTLFAILMPSHDPIIQTIQIPKYPPRSPCQAQEWSQDYWPTVYRKYNPFGPQPSVIDKTGRDILRRVGRLMSLALKAGKGVEESGIGRRVGAVIVHKGRLIVAAGSHNCLANLFALSLSPLNTSRFHDR